MSYNYMEEAALLKPSLVADRRELHKRAELGFELPLTRDYVRRRLVEMGYCPKEVGGGIVALVGQGGNTVLVRADMDALPQKERSGLPFCSETEAAHTCGHDIHTASLLGAAQILKSHEKELQGQVKLCFQPAEEIVKGAAEMVAQGVMDEPKVNAALGFHVAVPLPVGCCAVASGYVQASADLFRITVKGKGCHGSAPETGKDPITAGAFILTGLESLIAREVGARQSAVLTVGKFHAGEAANILPDEAVLEGTLRTYEKEVREKLKQRLLELPEMLAAGFGCKAVTEFLSETPACQNEEEMTEKVKAAARALLGPDSVGQQGLPSMGSDDFACYEELVPGCYLNVGFGDGAGQDGELHSLHSPFVRFDEAGLPVMAGLMASLSSQWLNDQKK